MDQSEKDNLKRLRGRIDEGEEFSPTLLARYNDLVAQEAREKGEANIWKVLSSVANWLFPNHEKLEQLEHVDLTIPVTCKPNLSVNINGCQSPIALDDFVVRTVRTIRATIAHASTDQRRKIMIVMCRCARGGKTTALNATATQLYALQISCLVVTFNGFSNFSRQPGESDSEALFRVISNELNPSLDKNKRRVCDWEALDAHIGNNPFVLLIDEINALRGEIKTELSIILKYYFLDKPNRHLVVTSHVPVYLDESKGTHVGIWSGSDISNRSVCLLEMPESFSAQDLKNMSPPYTDGITSGFATFYGGIPSLIYTVVMQEGESPAVRFSRLITGTSTDRNEFVSFVEALSSGTADDCLGKYLKFCSSVVSDKLLGVQVRWPPCYAQCILRRYHTISDARVLADAMLRLEDISDSVGDGKLWEQMTKVAILQHLIIAKYRKGAGPFRLCDNLDLSDATIKVQGLGEGVLTVEQAMDVISTHASLCSRPAMVVFYPNQMTFRQFDGFVLVTQGLGDVDRLAGYQCKDSNEGSRGVVPLSLNFGGHLLRSVAPSTVRENDRGWTYYNHEETDLFLGLSLSVMR